MRYTMLLNDVGGVRDDLLIGRPALENQQGDLYLVVNAGTKDQDFALIAATAGGEANLVRADDRALLALQGPAAEAAMAKIVPDAATLAFMHFARFETEAYSRLTISRTGYTGEDGFEILVRAEHAEALAERLLADPDVKPVGLGARDSLRLEAGLCLYGHDLDELTTPVEADLAWTIQKRRRALGDFPGAKRILSELADGPARKRVGLRPLERAPAREGSEIVKEGVIVGRVTSGGFSPSLNAPISIGYVDIAHAAPGVLIDLIVRGQPRPAEVVALPFVPHRYKKG
jgi:aminomethyltransferase